MELKVLGSVSPVIVDNNNCPGYLVNNNLLLGKQLIENYTTKFEINN